MAVSSAQVSVTTSATLLSAVESGVVQDGMSLAVQNADASVTVYLGASGVTTGTGYKLAAGDSVAVDLGPGEALYGIAASGTVTVHVLRTGL